MKQKIKDFLSGVYRISGRASRSEFWKKTLWILLAFLAYSYVLMLLGGGALAWLFISEYNPIMVLMLFAPLAILVCVGVALTVAQICIMMRRTQDLGWNGWFIVGIYVIHILLVWANYFNPYSRVIGGALELASLILIVLPFVIGLLKPQMFANQYGEYQEDTQDFRPYFKIYLLIIIVLVFLWIYFALFGPYWLRRFFF